MQSCRQRRCFSWLAVVFPAALLLTGCGDDNGGPNGGDGPETCNDWLTGSWLMFVDVDKAEQYGAYLVFDGQGTVIDIATFYPDSPAGSYVVWCADSTGTITVGQTHDPDMSIFIKVEPQLHADISAEAGGEVTGSLDIVSNPSRLLGTWSGTLNVLGEETPIQFDVDLAGTLVALTGLPGPVSGRAFADDRDRVVACFRTGHAGAYNQILLRPGAIQNDEWSGSVGVDAEGGDGTFAFQRVASRDYSGTWRMTLANSSQEAIVFEHTGQTLLGRTAYSNIDVLTATVEGAVLAGTLSFCMGDLSIDGIFPNENQFIGSVVLDEESQPLVGSKISESTDPHSPADVPSATIDVDGAAGDWDGVAPMIEDEEGDMFSAVDGGDLKAIYLAKSGARLCLRFDVWNADINGSNHYRIWFDDTDVDGCIDGDADARQIDITLEGSVWHVAAQTMGGPHGVELPVAGVAAATGSVLEVSVDLAELGPPDPFVLSGVVRDASSNNVDAGDWTILTGLP